MDASSLISLFGQEAGVALALNEAGTASLAFESGPVLHLEHDPQADALHCYVVLGQAPSDPMRRHDVFRRMLAAAGDNSVLNEPGTLRFWRAAATVAK